MHILQTVTALRPEEMNSVAAKIIRKEKKKNGKKMNGESGQGTSII